MSAYATPRLALASSPITRQSEQPGGPVGLDGRPALLDALIDEFADRVAERLGSMARPLRVPDSGDPDEWLDSRHAAEHLGIHRDTLRKLAAERAIPSEQDGPNCKLFFRRSDLDS